MLKGRSLPSKYLHKKLYFKKLTAEAKKCVDSFERMGKVSHFRYWTTEDYRVLLDFALAKSHQVLLDRPPCEHGIRFLSL